MGTEKFRNAKDDFKSGCRSFTSNGYPCSLSRKISIGVLVESSQTGSISKKQDDVTAPLEKVSGKENTTANIGNGEAVVKGKGNVTPAQGTSPWISTRPMNQLKPGSEVFGLDLSTGVPAGGGTCHKSNGVKAQPETHSVQFPPKQTTVLQSGDSKKDRVGASSSTAPCETSASAKDVIEDKTNDRRETLRTKLWDVLEAVSSPKRQVSQVPEVGVNKSILENNDKEADPNSKPRSSSDTIETSSGGPRHASRRPVTRSVAKKRASVAKKRAPHIMKKNINRNVPPSTSTRKHQADNIFSLKQGVSRGVEASVVDGFPKSLTKKRVTKGVEREAQKEACSPIMDNTDEFHLKTDKHKTTKCAMTSALGKIGQLRSFHLRTNNFEQPENEISKKDSYKPSATKIMEQADNVNQPVTGQHRNQQEDLPKSSFKNSVHPYLHNPTSETRSPSKSFSLQGTSDGEQDEISKKDSYKPSATKIMEQADNVNHPATGQHRNQQEDLPKSSFKNSAHPYLHIPTSETRSPSKSFSLQSTSDGEQDDRVPASCSPDSPLASKTYNQKRDMGTESSDDLKEVDNSPLAQSEPIIEEKDKADKQAKSSFKGRDFMSTKDGTPMSEERESESPSAEIGVAREWGFMHYGSDRSQCQGDIKVNSPISTFQKGSEERFQEVPGQDQEDALANAITLFVVALERVANKIKMVTSKRTAEVITSVSEEINVQLQNAEFQMKNDMGKVTSFTKSKRKRVEAAFAEQQEQLRLIYQRFRADVDQHLQECRSSVEGFEAEEIEFKGFMEKRRASQRKLLKQVDEAIESQLSDAERRISAVQKSAQAKMLQLKYSIAECLKEGVLNG